MHHIFGISSILIFNIPLLILFKKWVMISIAVKMIQEKII